MVGHVDLFRDATDIPASVVLSKTIHEANAHVSRTKHLRSWKTSLLQVLSDQRWDFHERLRTTKENYVIQHEHALREVIFGAKRDSSRSVIHREVVLHSREVWERAQPWAAWVGPKKFVVKTQLPTTGPEMSRHLDRLLTPTSRVHHAVDLIIPDPPHDDEACSPHPHRTSMAKESHCFAMLQGLWLVACCASGP